MVLAIVADGPLRRGQLSNFTNAIMLGGYIGQPLNTTASTYIPVAYGMGGNANVNATSWMDGTTMEPGPTGMQISIAQGATMNMRGVQPFVRYSGTQITETGTIQPY